MLRLFGKASVRHFRPIYSVRKMSNNCNAFQTHKTIDDVPGPPKLPGIGTMLDILIHDGGPGKGRIYVPFQRVRKYGKIYKEVWESGQQAVCIAGPNDVETVFRNEGKYEERISTPLFEYFSQKYNRKPGVFFLNGYEWYKHRSAMNKQLLVPRSLDKHVPEMNTIADELVKNVRKLRGKENTERSHEVENIDDLLFEWAFENVAYVIYGKRFKVQGQAVGSKVNEFIQATSTMLANVIPAAYYPTKLFDYYHPKSYHDFSTSFEKMYQITSSFMDLELNQHPREPDTSDEAETSLLKHLLSNDKLTPKEVYSAVTDLMSAGIDTTSNTMQWILYELAKNPDKQQALYEEIRAIIHNSQAQVASTDLQRLPLLKAVVKETLRLHPVLNENFRTLSVDLVLSDYHIPAGTRVIILAYVMGRDPQLFDQPDDFLPERWLKANKNTFDFSVFSSLPFGFGKRMCLGRRLAELELHILLAHFVSNFHLLYPENEMLYPIAKGSLKPEKPARIKFIDRKDN